MVDSFNNITKVSISELLGHPLNDIEEKYAPSCVYYQGNREIIFEGPRVSIIGSRHPSEEGLKITHHLTKNLVLKGITIVSGLAEGIDTIAHKVAMEYGGKTIAVLGTPLNQFYPSQNRVLQEKIMTHHLAVSQFQIGSPIQRANFPLRNRTMALLSHVSIITDATENSGTQHQGWEALRLGRPLYIVEDLIAIKKLNWAKKMREYGANILLPSDLKRILEDLPNHNGEVNMNVSI